jgi:hypothetical protein
MNKVIEIVSSSIFFSHLGIYMLTNFQSLSLHYPGANWQLLHNIIYIQAERYELCLFLCFGSVFLFLLLKLKYNNVRCYKGYGAMNITTVTVELLFLAI